MGDLRTPRLNMRNQKLKMGDLRIPRPNMGDQKSPKLPLDLTVEIIILILRFYNVNKCVQYVYVVQVKLNVCK